MRYEKRRSRVSVVCRRWKPLARVVQFRLKRDRVIAMPCTAVVLALALCGCKSPQVGVRSPQEEILGSWVERGGGERLVFEQDGVALIIEPGVANLRTSYAWLDGNRIRFSGVNEGAMIAGDAWHEIRFERGDLVLTDSSGRSTSYVRETRR